MLTKTIAKQISIGNVNIANDLPLVIIAGPSIIESKEHALEMAEALSYIASEMGIGFIYKSSFDKASCFNSSKSIGLENALPILAEIRQEFNCPVLTDIHSIEQCAMAAEFVDILQIPAFLCRQNGILEAAAKTGKIINIKKGQFLAPWDIYPIINKISESGNDNIMLTERGTSFGYNNLVADFRSLPIMAQTSYPVIFDATHSVEQDMGKNLNNERYFIPHLAKAAVAVGVAAIFIETHQDPDNAPSNGDNMVHLKNMPKLIAELIEYDKLTKNY